MTCTVKGSQSPPPSHSVLVHGSSAAPEDAGTLVGRAALNRRLESREQSLRKRPNIVEFYLIPICLINAQPSPSIMASTLLLLVALLVTLAASSPLELTGETWQNTIDNGNPVFAKFYAPW